MSCQTVQRFISAYLDDSLSRAEQNDVTRHLAHCRECAVRSEQLQHLRMLLRDLPAATPPAQVAGRLRVMASHERLRRLNRVDTAARLRHAAGYLKLLGDNLMRPLALPFAGGLASALFLFGMLVPTLLFQFNFRDDVPTAFYTEPSLMETGGTMDVNTEAVVELTLNERGQVTDYLVARGNLDRNAENNLLANLVLFSSYSPATLFGQPTSGKVRVLVSQRRSRIVVRG